MKFKIFSLKEKVTTCPQAKLLGFDLIKAKFNGRLSEEEILILENGINTQDLDKLRLLNPQMQYRLLMCAVVSKTKQTSAQELFNFSKHTLNLAPKELTEIFLLSGEEKLLNDCFSEMSNNELRVFELDNLKFFINEMTRRGLLSSVNLVLNYQVNGGQRIKDFYSSYDYNLLYNIACENGHLEVIQHLEAIDGFDKKAASEARNYIAYRLACRNGHLEVIQHLEAIDGFDKKAAAEASDYEAYISACRNSHLEVIQHLEEINGFDKKAAAEASDYAAYLLACENGHLEVIQHLEAINGFDKKAAAETYDYEAYLFACLNGHLKVIQHLEAIDGFDKKAAAEIRGYEAYRFACANGHLKVIQHLEEIDGFDKNAAAETRGYSAYLYACGNGHLEVIQHLEAINGFDKKAAAKASNYGAYHFACRNGHLEVIQHLEEINSFDKKAAAKAQNYAAYRLACENCHLEVIQHLEEIDGFDKNAAAKDSDYTAYRLACENGHLEVIQHLEAINGFDKKAAAEARGYAAYLLAGQNSHFHIIRHLLSTPSCLSYAEKHDAEYGKQYVYPFVAEKLINLQRDKLTFETNNPNGVFDVNREMSELYFIIIRNLIRRGVSNGNSPEDFSNDILLLLSIPAVRNLCHQRVDIQSSSPGQENELLRLAQATGNIAAAEILVGLPEVLRLAEQNNYYQDEVINGPDLRRLAQDRESSMVALSPNEKEVIDKLKRNYQQNINAKGGNNAVFAEFVNLLKSKYNQNPAIISILNSKGKTLILELPIDWDAFQEFKNQLTPEQYQDALQAYFKHDVHTALRYLTKPNKWMHPNASYVNVMRDEQGNITDERYSTFEDYKQLIALFYTAAFDEQTPAIDGYTVESRKELFIKELALIGRAHNWDKSRPILDKNGNVQYKDGGLVKEEYDDLELDRPSCFSGVNRRLFQSLLGHGLFKPVTQTIIKQAINEQLKEYFDKIISRENSIALKEAYNGIVEADENMQTHIKTLEQLNIPADLKNTIIQKASEQLANTYKANFDDYKDSFVRTMRNYLNSGQKSKQPDIMAFNESLSLVSLINKLAEEQAPETSYSYQSQPSSSFFKQTSNEPNNSEKEIVKKYGNS